MQESLLPGLTLPCVQPDEIVPENSRARGLTTLVTEMKHTEPYADVDLMAPGPSPSPTRGPRNNENLLAAKLRSSSGAGAGSGSSGGDDNLLVEVVKEKLCGQVKRQTCS